MAKKSITETGPKALRGVRNPDLYPTQSLGLSDIETQSIRDELARSTYANYEAAHGHLGYQGLNDPSLYAPIIDTSLPGYGDSMYDKGILIDATPADIQDQRAEAQPWYAKIGAGLTKGVVLAGTTFLDGTIGLLVGGAESINRGDISGLWDNDFSKAMQAINEWSEEALPNYYSQNELNSPWYENIFTANFLGDKFIKNLGFSIGAIYSGGVYAAPFKAAKVANAINTVFKTAKATPMVSSAVGSIISAVNEGRVEALNNSKDWFRLQKQQLDDWYDQKLDSEYKPQFDEAMAEYNATKGTLVQGPDGSMYDPAYLRYKSKVEALQNELNTKRQNRGSDKVYSSTLSKITEDRLKMGNADLLMNIPILTASNLVQFGKFFGGGYRTARKTTNIAGRAGNYTAGTTKLGTSVSLAKGALSEGLEEISQKAASVSAGNYYATDVSNWHKSQIDPNAEKETLDWMKSVAQGVNETVNDGSSWEEFFIGTLTGALGIPTFRSLKSSDGSFRSPIVMQGGAYNGWKEHQQKVAREQEIADYMNSRVQSPEFLNYYQSLIRHNKYQADMNKAVEEGNEFDFKNAEHAQLISDIVMFDNAGKLGDLEALIGTSLDTSEENLESMVRNTTAVGENNTPIGPFAQYARVDSDGQISVDFGDSGVQEMTSKLNNTREEFSNTIKNYVKIKDDLDVRTGEVLSDEQLQELTWMKSQLGNWADRATAMSGEVKQVIGKVIGNLDSFIRFQDTIRTEEGMNNANLTDKYNRADKNVRDAQRAVASLNVIRNLDDANLAATLAKNPDFVKGLMKEVSLLDDTVIEADEREDVLNKLADIIKLGNAADVYNAKFKEYLSNPGQQVADHERANQETAQVVQKENNASLRQKLDQATSVAQFREILNSEQDAATRDAVLQTMESEDNQIAKNYRETLQYNNELSAALNELGETDQVAQDAMTLWKEQFNAAENLEQLANPNSIFINNEEAFMEDSGGDIDIAGNRFQSARYALQRAMSKVNNDIKFKNRFSKEYKRPVNEPVADKGIDKDETGYSETPTPVGNVTAEMVASENSDANKSVKTQRDLDRGQQSQRKYYRPAIPELHIEASKEGDFRPFDTVVAEREQGVDFSSIYSYLRDNGAFDYVNAAKLKPGDTLGFMIDPEFNDHTIFLVDTRNNQIVGSIDESDASVTRYEGLEGIIKRVRDEFAKRGEETTGKFFATPQTRVSKMMIGRIPYSTEERSLADIPGVLDGETKPIFGIIKNGVLTTNLDNTNEEIDDRLIIKPADTAQKEGRLYLLIPNAAGTYSPAAIRVKHFNTQEFNLADATVANTPIGKGINEALDRLADATSQDDVSIAMKELAQDIYMQDVMITWFDAKAGSGIVVSKKVRKPDGTYEMVTINGQEQIKEEKTTIYFQSSKKSAIINGMEIDIEAAKEMGANLSPFGQPRDTADIRKDILNTILRYNLPLQVDASMINKPGYNNKVIKSNILTSNLREAKVIGSWFITDYFNNQGNLQRAVSPASVKPAPSRKVSSPVGGTEGVVQGTRVTISGTPYIVDLKSNMAINEKTGEKRAFSAFNSQSLIDMAWAQETFGDATESSRMTENKIITPNGDVLDRSTGHYITGDEAQRIKDKIAGKNKETESRIAQSKRVIADIYENQKKVDKARTDKDYYYILEEDGQYHQYSRVHSRLGDNWLGERTETENSKRALEVGTDVDKVIRDFFTLKETPTRPETLSEGAFIDLITKLTEIKSKMEQMGETFMTNNIVLFQKYADGTRVAGEVDILAVDKSGNFKIYDVKTSKYSFSDRHFTEKSSMQRMSTKDYYTLQLSAYQNLFESQYGIRPTGLAILPFTLTYDKDKVNSITQEKGIPITYNPAVNVPLASVVQTPRTEGPLPIFNSTMETMITNPKEQNRVLPENAFEEGGEIGYYEKDGKLYTGYLKKIGEVEVTYGSGRKDMVPIHVTKVRDTGFGREGEFGSTSEYLTVFPNGKAISTKTNDTNDNHAAEVIMKALSAKPEKVLSFSNEKTQIYNPMELEESITRTVQGTTQQSQEGASRTIQKENIVNKKTAKRTRHKLRAKDSTRPIWNREKELDWLGKVLPQLSEQDRIRVVKGLIQVSENGPVAWGMFSDGIVTLSDIATEGTTYHESFHVVFNLMLTPQERSALFTEARQQYGNKSEVELEEDMAEEFREYVTTRQNAGLLDKIKNFFKDLWIKVTNWNSVRPHLTAYYQMINKGKYSNRELPTETLSQAKARQEEYSKEMQDILDKAPRNSEGKLLVRPRGPVSNLTERQYAQVRTKAFKDWFGDWENDSKNASQVVDENGEPLVVYHNTPFEFNGVFDMGHKSRTMPWTSEPFGHVGTQETANKIKGTQFALFLNIRNPLETPDFVHETVSSMLAELYKQGIISRDKYSSLRGMSNSELRNLMLSLGYDGTKYENKAEGGGISYSFIKPNQIKSAKDNIGTFSRTNDNIRYREVHNSSFKSVSEEIQESLLKKGWTEEKFDSISQEERDQAVKCIAL